MKWFKLFLGRKKGLKIPPAGWFVFPDVKYLNTTLFGHPLKTILFR